MTETRNGKLYDALAHRVLEYLMVSPDFRAFVTRLLQELLAQPTPAPKPEDETPV